MGLKEVLVLLYFVFKDERYLNMFICYGNSQIEMESKHWERN